MNPQSFINIIDRIRNSWEKRGGLLLSLFLLLSLLFALISKFEDEITINNSYILYLVPSVLICLFVTILWIFSTNRFFVKITKKFTLGLILYVDEDEAEHKIKRIVSPCVRDINKDFKDISVRLLPINYKTHKKDVESYLKNRGFSFDCILFAKAKSGNFKTETDIEQRIAISELSFVGKFNVYDNLEIFRSSINLVNDLKIRMLFKNWMYVEANSSVDKTKLQFHFRDTILHYIGIYLLYLQELELALSILKTLHNPKLSKLEILKPGKLKISKASLAACRLNNILINLFFVTAINKYNVDNDLESAYSILKECEKMFNKHSDSYAHYISLARFSYEKGYLSEAKEYTDKACSLKGETIDVLLNKGFFAVLENNPHETCKFYRKIFKKRSSENNNIVDVVAFLEKQSESKDASILFGFAIGFLLKVFVDEESGNGSLDSFLKDYLKSINNKDDELVLFTKEVIDFKSIPHKTNDKKKTKKRKKKRKR